MKVRDIDGMKGQDKTTSFSYHVDGQLAERSVGNESERFFWDGLALVRRNDTSYLNEPSVTGGNPILADDKVMFNDMLGNTLGIYGKDLQEVKRTSFGSGDETGFFTGKPYVKELGAVFLFRNYRSDLGKWQTSDPLGYPDGWNNFAYCKNAVTSSVDLLGFLQVEVCDANNGYSVVTSPAALTIGNFSFVGGGFSCQAPLATKDNNDKLVILLGVSLVIGDFKRSADIAKGTTATYYPHPGVGIISSNAPYEAVLGHEMGHATNFFSNVLPAFIAAITALNIDESQTLDEINSQYNFTNILAGIISNYLPTSNALANAGTYSGFDSTWKQLSDSGGAKRWIKE